MSEPLDDAYLTWLYSQVASVRVKQKSRTYWTLMRQLYITEFVWLVPNDDNRVEDGRDLRYEFLDDHEIEDDDVKEWRALGCSMLEMMIGLSRRLSFEAEGEPRAWFWILIHNINLERYTDAYSDTPQQEEEIDDVLHRVIYRLYDDNGHGGLFPLTQPDQDQTKVELWYQLSAYLLERE